MKHFFHGRAPSLLIGFVAITDRTLSDLRQRRDADRRDIRSGAVLIGLVTTSAEAASEHWASTSAGAVMVRKASRTR